MRKFPPTNRNPRKCSRFREKVSDREHFLGFDALGSQRRGRLKRRFFKYAAHSKNPRLSRPWSSGGIPVAAGGAAVSIMRLPACKFAGDFFRVELDVVEGLGG